MIAVVLQVFLYLSLLGQVAILTVILLFLAQIFFKNKVLKNLRQKISPYSYHLTFFLSLIATLASLFLSEVAKFQPCILCWYQRIAMYPQPLLFYIAILRKERLLKPYLLPVNVIGALIALYHYSLQVLPKSMFVPCDKSLTGVSVSCTEGYKFYLGYMSFPLMAFTVFVLLIILLLFSYGKNPRGSK